MSVLTCYLTFGSKSTLVSVLQSNTTVEPQKSKIVNLSASPRRLQRLIATKQHQGGSAEPPIPLTRKSKMVRLKVPPGELRRIFGVPDIYSLAVELQAKRLEHLTHTALLSVFGSRKRFPGIRFLEKPGSLTAIHVAPAVWIPRFFQVCLGPDLDDFTSNRHTGRNLAGSVGVFHFFRTWEPDELRVTESSSQNTESGARSTSGVTPTNAFAYPPVDARSETPSSNTSGRPQIPGRSRLCGRGCSDLRSE